LTGAAALVALADCLFYDHRLGLSLALFLLALAAGSAGLNTLRAASTRRMGAFLLLWAGLLPILEDVSPLSVTIALTATIVFARMLTERRALTWQEHLRAALRVPFSGVFRLLGDLVRARRASLRSKGQEGVVALALSWAIPLGLCSVFAGLFVSANPLLESWLNRIDLNALLSQLLSWRAAFWAAMLCLTGPHALAAPQVSGRGGGRNSGISCRFRASGRPARSRSNDGASDTWPNRLQIDFRLN